jgi:uncharacterized membrane protein
MKALLLVLGIIGLVGGLLFAAQGAGIINWPQSSFMVNSTEWVLYGLVIAGIGLVLIGLGSRRRG